MSYRILNQTTGKWLEAHSSPRAAERAMCILNAHELRNGREPNMVIDPPLDGPSDRPLGLPSWAQEALGHD